MNKHGLIIMVLGMLLFITPIVAQETESVDSVGVDASAVVAMAQDSVMITPKKSTSLLGRFIRYFSDSNKEKESKKFDISFIAGPAYDNTSSFSVGVMGSGLYRMNGCAPEMQPSNVTLYLNASVIGMVKVGIDGNNFFPEDKYRLNYSARLVYFPLKYWGIGYDEANVDENETDMKRIMGKIDAEFLIRIADNFYVGPMVSAMMLKAYDIEESKMHLYHGQPLKLHNIGAGVTLQYDSRDNVTNPHRGFYVNVSQMFRPKFIGNDFAFSTTDVKVNAYQKLWKGAVLAEQVLTKLNFGNPSWEMMAQLGGSDVMRGYYVGRYRDKHIVAAQAELRQYVWKRCGFTVWGGAGSVFHNKESMKKVLPNYGVGFRWEFKKNVNVRLDYGFGKGGQNGIIFNINEAF